MTRQEKRKWTIAAVLAVVLVGLLWVQYGGATATSPSQAQRHAARRRPAPPSEARVSQRNKAVLVSPADPAELTAINPFDRSRITTALAEREPQAEDTSAADSGERAEITVPDWLKSGRIQARLRVGRDDAIVVNGRVLRVGEVVDGVEIVRIENDTVWVRQASRPKRPVGF